MSSADKQSDVSVQRKDDCVPDKEKGQNDAKSDTSPQKRSASELSSTEEVKQKMQKTDHKTYAGFGMCWTSCMSLAMTQHSRMSLANDISCT
ncbi:unnamed protein product [Larinioides sclopetarius]|uniref:Uncharacterized protein n=1 Tax=Larinioides sclopetarius TaxID=280406 RepID=A0AAV1ZDC5_9ARAC